MSQVLERQQHWLTCSQYLPTDACTRWRRGGRRNADCRLDHAASGCSPGGVLSLLRHMATMDTLAALGWSICATGAGAASHVQAPARLVAQHQNPAKRRTVLAPAALNQMPRCMADSRDSTVPGQFSISPDFDAELPAVPAPQRASYHPHQLHISTSRELLAYPWWSFASTKTGYPQESNQKPHDRADSAHCVCRHGATVCMHLWAGTASM